MKSLAELLVDARLVTPDQVRAAQAKQAVHGGLVGRFLVSSGAISDERIARFLADHLRIPLVLDLAGLAIDASVAKLVPMEMAQRYSLFPAEIMKDGSVQFLVVAMADPTNLEAIDAVKFKTGRRVQPAVTTEAAVEAAIRAYHFGERRRDVAAQSPVQFAGHEVDLGAATDDEIPIVTGVEVTRTRPPVQGAFAQPAPAIQGLAPTAATEIMELSDLEAMAPQEPAPQEPDPPEPELSFAALAPPLSTLAPPVSAPAPAPPVLGPVIAQEAPNVRSTGSPGAGSSTTRSPETSTMAKTPDALAAAPFCPDCGAARVATAKFCPHCGCSFTGASRAKGAPPATAPATRPMMPAVSPAAAALSAAVLQLKPGAPVDVDVLEGLKNPAGATVVQLRPRTASAANVDEPVQLAGKETASVGLGVTLVAQGIISDASRPDESEVLLGETKKPSSQIVPARLGSVTEGMARVDDIGALAPTLSPAATRTPVTAGGVPTSIPKAAPSWSAPATLAIMSPVPGAAAAALLAASAGSAEALAAVSLDKLEGISKTSVLTAQGALVDDALALSKSDPFKLALGVTHMALVHADAALVDDPRALMGETVPRTSILRAVLERTSNAMAQIDDPKSLMSASKLSLAKDWQDAAERPIPRKDARNDAPVPKSREIFVNTADAPPPPPPPEPKVEYTPAPPVTAGAPAPWAVFSGAPPAPPAAAAAAPQGGPGLATMIMSLNDFEKQALAEKLRAKAADVEAKDKK